MNTLQETVTLARLTQRLTSGDARRLRRTARLSLMQVARTIGCTHVAVSKWERNLSKPTGPVALRYATLLDALEEVQRSDTASVDR